MARQEIWPSRTFPPLNVWGYFRPFSFPGLPNFAPFIPDETFARLLGAYVATVTLLKEIRHSPRFPTETHIFIIIMPWVISKL